MIWTQMQTLYFAVFLSLAIGHLTGLIVYTTKSQQAKSIVKTVLFVSIIVYIFINIFVIPYMNKLGYSITLTVSILCSPIFTFLFSLWLYSKIESKNIFLRSRVLLYTWLSIGFFIVFVFIIEFLIHLFSS